MDDLAAFLLRVDTCFVRFLVRRRAVGLGEYVEDVGAGAGAGGAAVGDVRVEDAVLARQESRAHARRGLTLSLPVAGMIRLSGVLGVEDAAIVHAALTSLLRPSAIAARLSQGRHADAAGQSRYQSCGRHKISHRLSPLDDNESEVPSGLRPSEPQMSETLRYQGGFGHFMDRRVQAPAKP